jgi:nitrogen-specific signal transduction histidine kinase/ActR/RegA family two-component response regulator
MIHVAKDITDLQSLERQLQHAQKMEAIGTLAGGIAHDFNNILSPILGYVEMMMTKLPTENPLQRDLQQVYTSANRAKELVKQILTFSRQSESEVHPLNVLPVIKEALKLLRASIPSNIEIKEKIPSDCPPILADPTRIHQILMNLCTNAYQAMLETGGVLGVSLTSAEIGSLNLFNKYELNPGLHVILEVSDSGPGIPKDITEKIFDPYFTTKGKGEGTGLGLAVVHGIVKNYKGAITVYSEPGGGSVFRVYLPAITMDPTAKPLATKALPLPVGTERILLVDDEKSIVEMEAELLRGLGYKVTEFTNSETALETFRINPNDFDLICTDMTMPKITGDLLTNEILRIRPKIPVILCTGFSELISEKTAVELGVKKYLTKPVSMKTFANSVRQVLDESTEQKRGKGVCLRI